MEPDESTLATVRMLNEITQRVIVPEKEKGLAYAMQKAQEFQQKLKGLCKSQSTQTEAESSSSDITTNKQ